MLQYPNTQPDSYCPFCGVILHYTPFAPIKCPFWFSAIRAVFVKGTASDTVALTGVGYLASRNILRAPVDSKSSCKDENPTVDITLFRTSDSCWGYGFHDACWRLFLACLQDIDEADIIKPLFRFFWSTECPRFSIFSLGHDYAGATEMQKRSFPGEPFKLSLLFYADPSYVPPFEDLKDLVSTSQFHAQGVEHDYSSTPRERTSPLENLPVELLYMVSSYLSLKDVLGLRLLSRPFYRLLAPEELPQSFWKTRFMVPHEQDFIFPDFTTSQEDWFRLFLGVDEYLNDKSKSLPGSKSLINRKRVRGLIEPMARLLEVKIRIRGQPYGVRITPRTKYEYVCSDSQARQQLGSHLRISRIFGGQLASQDYQNQLTEGCRPVEYMVARFPTRTMEPDFPNEVRISVVKIGNNKYVSGIRIASSSPAAAFPSEIGYFMPGETIIRLPDEDEIRTLEVVFSATGLRGIRFIYSSGASSPWAGQFRGEGLARGLIQLESSAEYDIIAGLDHYKILELGLVAKNGDTAEEPNRIVSRLWSPMVPNSRNIRITPLRPSLNVRPFEPIIDMNFAGSNGWLLPMLKRVVVHMVSDFQSVVGFSFVFEKHTLSLGKTGEAELSAVIDGPGGERITNLQVLGYEFRYEQRMRGCQIGTNYSRNIVFSAIPRFPHLQKDSELLELPKNYSVTGLIATKDADDNTLQKLGLQGHPSKNHSSSEPKRIRDLSQELRESQVEYDKMFAVTINVLTQGDFCTYAPFESVRRITASTGSEGRSRTPCNVSGLRFDYHNEWHCPTIVGQWMNELDTFELDQGERIEGLTVWLSTEPCYRTVNPVEPGRVIAIRIDSSSKRHKIFKADNVDISLEEYKQQQYQSNMRENLTAISWILNGTFDRVRAVIQLVNPAIPPPILIPQHDVPFDQAQKLFFEITDQASRVDKLVQMVAHVRNNEVLGVSFDYQSGCRKSMGYTDIPNLIEYSIGLTDYEEILVFEVEIWRERIIRIEFETRRSNGDPASLEGTRKSLFRSPENKGDWTSTWCATEAIAAKMPVKQALSCQYIFPEDAKLVGLYVACQEFSRIGGVFQSMDI
ncbi:F-box domain containing protein [Coccidioides posadasii C735 delta SOWgp]|uniref:F-box domain containing protein n=1 Tax=Coccidioides posadasii (strain C735) TaxID=222929 RepID=C5PB27_COCP7|nr:F-box domain containing protein [Coccidioides posadasii C735 delta SOWgp]EER25811.1 F-box domain containing protein [Coccidioides posadasii C735 delta SOWgp]|eukprot:XP_003067956.1 F-box domain containing protein [Coccidioides posadasii C735 delta SOWgp]